MDHNTAITSMMVRTKIVTRMTEQARTKIIMAPAATKTTKQS